MSELAVPIIAGVIATNIMGMVDALMVGHLGNAPLAAVALGGQWFILLFAPLLGLAGGVQALVARAVGESDAKTTGRVLNLGIVLALVLAATLLVCGYASSFFVMSHISQNPETTAHSIDYLWTRLPSLLFIGVNVVFRAYWVGVSLAKWSMVSIVSLSLANILFNYALIFGHFGAPALGVTGAGLGSTLAVIVGLLVNFGFALKFARSSGFLRQSPDLQTTRHLLNIAYPESIRQLLFCTGVVALYAVIAQLGTAELAAFYVVIVICQLAYLPHLGIGGAATTLVGESVGRQDLVDAKRWGRQTANISLVTLTLVALPVAIYAPEILGLFLSDNKTVLLATLPLQLALLAHVLDGYSKTICCAFIGAGATRIALALTMIPQWLILLPASGIVVYLGWGLNAAMWVFLASMTLSAAFCGYWWARTNLQNVVV
ncbi:MAG: MATE family efflux transporter [Pseudomonadota bacterium]